jgi:hypothetical protein
MRTLLVVAALVTATLPARATDGDARQVMDAALAARVPIANVPSMPDVSELNDGDSMSQHGRLGSHGEAGQHGQLGEQGQVGEQGQHGELGQVGELGEYGQVGEQGSNSGGDSTGATLGDTGLNQQGTSGNSGGNGTQNDGSH